VGAEVRGIGVLGRAWAQLSRWAGAATHRLNSSWWKQATGETLNTSIATDGKTLKDRIEFEAQNNPYLRGIIEKYATYVVGKTGPRPQFMGPDAQWNAKAERVWSDWFAQCDDAGRLTGVEKVKLWLRQLFISGEFLEQIVTGEGLPDGVVQLRLKSIASKRLSASMGTAVELGSLNLSNILINTGVEINDRERVVAYHVMPPLDSLSLEVERIPAKDMIHFFKVEEPGQLRGVPWLACTLQVAADLRALDESLLDAARTAATLGLVYYTESDMVEVEAWPEGLNRTLKRNMEYAAPPGYKPMQIKGEHPNADLITYREDRLRELGLAVNMPLLLILLDASNHNYSSARFDDRSFWEEVDSVRGEIERLVLDRLMALVLSEASLIPGLELERMPKYTTWMWTWPAKKQVDPAKEAAGDAAELKNTTTTMQQLLAQRGVDFEEHVRRLKYEKEAYAREGLPWPCVDDGGVGVDAA
jgi:lambda family phage portal protein